MINPFTSTPVAAPAGPVSPDIARPATTPAPARQVAATGKTLDSNTATEKAQRPDADNGEVVNPLDKALKLVNANLEAWSTGMRFHVDADSGRIVVSIVDNHTGTVLRTVPSDAVIRVAKMISKLEGAGIDTQA